MGNTTNNIETLKKCFEREQKQNPRYEILNALDFFTESLDYKDLKIYDAKISQIYNPSTECPIFIWNILLTGPGSRAYAEDLAQEEISATVFIHDLEGTINGEELFQITLVID